MNLLKKYRLFFGSVLFGILLWFVSNTIMPFEAVEVLKSKTIMFIVGCYLAMVLGFVLFKHDKIVPQGHKTRHNFLKGLIIIITISFFLRWIDLFVLREVSFFNSYKFNRILSFKHSHKSNIVFVIASIFKAVYFFPFVMVVRNKVPLNFYSISAFILLLFPTIEALVLGTRIVFFEIGFVVIITIIAFKKPKLNLKNTIYTLLSVVLLMTISYMILLKRETKRNKNVYTTIVNARYNDLLKPNKQVLEFIKDSSKASILRNYALILLQSGQYINHGVYEFNHIIDDKSLATTKGTYGFNPFLKLFNKLGLIEGFENVNPSPRKNVYLTAFGSFYIDFRWCSILFFFFLGIFQRYVYDFSFFSGIHAPLLIYLAIINVFLPILNYIRGAGVYPFVGFLLIWFAHRYYTKTLNEKSPST